MHPVLALATQERLKEEMPFNATDVQDRFRRTMRKCVALGELLAEQWSQAHFLEFEETVTTGMYDKWMEGKEFAEWFTDGVLRKRSAYEMALCHQAAEATVLETLKEEKPADRLRAAASIFAEGVRQAKGEKGAGVKEQTPAERQAALIAEIRRTG